MRPWNSQQEWVRCSTSEDFPLIILKCPCVSLLIVSRKYEVNLHQRLSVSLLVNSHSTSRLANAMHMNAVSLLLDLINLTSINRATLAQSRYAALPWPEIKLATTCLYVVCIAMCYHAISLLIKINVKKLTSLKLGVRTTWSTQSTKTAKIFWVTPDGAMQGAPLQVDSSS